MRKLLHKLGIDTCKWVDHDLQYRGYTSVKATLFGKPWRWKINCAVYECKWCGWNNKPETAKVEELWRTGTRNKRSMI